MTFWYARAHAQVRYLQGLDTMLSFIEFDTEEICVYKFFF